MNTLSKTIKDSVSSLPEVYQPIYGYEGRFNYRRESIIRLNEIKKICENLKIYLNRKIHILDLGCAQGYFSFNLSKYCNKIDAIDSCLDNIKICNLLKNEFKFKNINFYHKDATQIDFKNKYDLVLICNVIHHICNQKSLDYTINYLRNISRFSRVVILELANTDENQEWSKHLPETNDCFTNIFNFSDKICEFKNHLNEKLRPFYLLSNEFLYFDNSFLKINKTLKKSHKFERNIHESSKIYYFAQDKIVKKYNFLKKYSLKSELLKEKVIFNLYSSNKSTKAQIYHEKNHSYLIRDRLEGALLYEYLYDANLEQKLLIIKKILCKLAYYEERGLYHNDLRLWNVLVDSNENIHIIDYSSFGKNTLDVLGYSVFFSFTITITEIFNLDFLHFPFRVLPQFTNVPDSAYSLILHIINNLKQIKFSDIYRNYSRIIATNNLVDNYFFFTETNVINNNLINYYHHNQSFVSDYVGIKQELEDNINKSKYYISSYHHLNKVVEKQNKYNNYLNLKINHKISEINSLKNKNRILNKISKTLIILFLIALMYLLINFQF